MLLAISLCACRRGEEEKDAAQPLPVAVAPAQRGDVSDVVELSGALEPPLGLDVKLAPLTAGRLAEVLAAEGDRVRKGAVLARLEMTPLRDAAAQAEAQVTAARAQRQNAEVKLRRAQEAFKAGVAAAQEVDDARLQADSAAAAFRSAEAQLSTARNQLARAELRAPFDGVVARLLAAAGEQVDSSRPVLEVASVGTLELRAPVPFAAAARLRPGQGARLSIEALPDSSFPATVAAISPVLDPATGAAQVRLRVPNPTLALKAGVVARARVVVDTHHGVLAVPRSALLASEEGQAVEVVDQGKAKRVPVELGYLEHDRAEVTSGLAEGQSVIVQGAYAVPDGTTVAPVRGDGGAHAEAAGAIRRAR